MTVNYGSPAHILSILCALLVCALFYFLLRGKSRKISERVIFCAMIFNLLQHLFKWLIYPQHIEEGFSLVSTAYNMCAVLIILSPLAMLLKVGFVRDFFFLFGSAAGIVAILVPYWHIGATPFSWEYFRYMLCHVLLFSNSMLPLLLGIHKPSYKSIPLLGLAFIFTIGIIILNDTVCYYTGIYRMYPGITLYESLKFASPVWSFGPPESFSFLVDAAKVFVPDPWVVSASGDVVPVLWYAVPLYLIITFIAIPVCLLIDRNNFIKDYNNFQQKRKRSK